MSNNRVYHVISNTHWDREWRFPFQRNRQMLVEMIDKVLQILDAEPDYRAFHLDSQSVVLTDYLEIRPEKKEIIKKFVEEKRLFIGPWFILPDEFLVGGENLIRNLLLGHKICSGFGGASKIGYSPFSWGQISQLPQLYNQFGIELIMFYRGVNSLDSKKAEFLWEGADGTKAVTSRFSTMPRYNFYFYIYRPVVHNEGFYDVEYKWSDGGTPFHFADSQMAHEDYFIINPLDKYFKENIVEQVTKIINDQADDFTTPNVIWMEGHDSSGPNAKTVNIIKDINELIPGVNAVHSTLEDYSDMLKKSVKPDELALVKGERRSAQYDNRSGNLYGYVTSARMYLKMKNFEVEKWLQFYAEPFNSAAGMLGLNIKDEYLNIAWNYLIQNSAHDSIGGCSLDDIHEDMMNRYKQTLEISKGVFERACKHIALNINTASLFKGNEQNNIGIALVALNPNFYNRNEIVKAVIDIPAEFDKKSFSIRDEKNKQINGQLISKSDTEPVLEQLIDRPMFFRMKRYECYIELKNIPQFGFRTFKIVPDDAKALSSGAKICKLSKGLPVFDNSFITVKVNANGTFNVSDKTNKQVYNNLGYLYDEGESGHAWVHNSVAPVLTSLDATPEIKIIENGDLFAKVSIKYNLKVYSNIEERIKNRKPKTSMPVEVILSLSKLSEYINIDLNIDNTAEDHRLRIMFPSGIAAKASNAEGQFDVVERPLNRPDTKDWIEQPMYDYPMHHFVDLSDGKNGAAVFTNGIKEYEILDNESKTIALTLFRAFRYIIQPSSKEDYSHQKGSQCLGKQSYRLAFYPHKGNWQKGNVYREALNFNNEIRLFQTGRNEGKLNPVSSFFSIDNKDFVFSCLKRVENNNDNSFIIRIYNPTNKEIRGNIKSLFNIKAASFATLEEKDITKPEQVINNTIPVIAASKKIVTIKLSLDI